MGGRWGEKPSPRWWLLVGNSDKRGQAVKEWNEHPRKGKSPYKTTRKERKASDVVMGATWKRMTSAPPGMTDGPW